MDTQSGQRPGECGTLLVFRQVARYRLLPRAASRRKAVEILLVSLQLAGTFTHNIEKLVELCEQHNATFQTMKSLGQALTPYAVHLRYDEDFWPSEQETATALQSAQTLRAFIIPLLPATMQPPT